MAESGSETDDLDNWVSSDGEYDVDPLLLERGDLERSDCHRTTVLDLLVETEMAGDARQDRRLFFLCAVRCRA